MATNVHLFWGSPQLLRVSQIRITKFELYYQQPPYLDHFENPIDFEVSEKRHQIYLLKLEKKKIFNNF